MPKVSSVAEFSILLRLSDRVGISIQELRGKRKTEKIVRARHAAMRLLRRAGMSFPEIGRALNRHHTTVLYACGRIGARIKPEPEHFPDTTCQ